MNSAEVLRFFIIVLPLFFVGCLRNGHQNFQSINAICNLFFSLAVNGLSSLVEISFIFSPVRKKLSGCKVDGRWRSLVWYIRRAFVSGPNPMGQPEGGKPFVKLFVTLFGLPILTAVLGALPFFFLNPRSGIATVDITCLKTGYCTDDQGKQSSLAVEVAAGLYRKHMLGLSPRLQDVFVDQTNSTVGVPMRFKKVCSPQSTFKAKFAPIAVGSYKCQLQVGQECSSGLKNKSADASTDGDVEMCMLMNGKHQVVKCHIQLYRARGTVVWARNDTECAIQNMLPHTYIKPERFPDGFVSDYVPQVMNNLASHLDANPDAWTSFLGQVLTAMVLVRMLNDNNFQDIQADDISYSSCKYGGFSGFDQSQLWMWGGIYLATAALFAILEAVDAKFGWSRHIWEQDELS